MMKLSDYVMRFIAEMGVKHVFMFSGGGAMHLNDSLGRCDALQYICNLHEQAAAICMEAYSQTTGNFGVAMVTTGPGGTNAITGVAAAWIDSIPCIVISGQVKRDDLMKERGVRQMGGQEIDIVSIVKPITKYAVTIMEPKSIKYHLEKAVYLAKNGRPGPVWIDIPLDVQAHMIDEDTIEGFIANDVQNKIELGERFAQKILVALSNAKRPLILAGNGIRQANAKEDFLSLARNLKIPVLTTWKAADFLGEEDPLFCGRPGAIGQRAANFAQQKADVLLVIGARLDLAQTGYNHQHFAPNAKTFIVDIDQAELDKLQIKEKEVICADAKVFIELLLNNVSKHYSLNEQTEEWFNLIREWKRKYPVIVPEYWRYEQVSTYVLIEVLSELLTVNDVLVPGSSGACAEITLQAFKVKYGQRIINSPGLGAMGFGLPAAIGACIGADKKRTICINGDGGIQLNIQELETLARLKLPIKIFVLNNNGYGSIRFTQMNYFESRFVACDENSGLTLPNILKVANAYGLLTYQIKNNRNLRADVQHVLEMDGPVICEVITPPNQPTLPKLSSKKNEDGTMESKPLEDLYPFLDRVELEQIMKA